MSTTHSATRTHPLGWTSILLGLAILHLTLLYTLKILVDPTQIAGWINTLSVEPTSHSLLLPVLTLISKHLYFYTTILCIIGVLVSVWLMISFRMSSAITAAIIFFVIWLFTLGVPGFWFFEFLVPLTASIVLISAYKCYPKTCRPQGIGFRLFDFFTTRGYI